jgi:hypothetical protein
LNLGGMAVLDGIGDSFLADAQKIHFDLAGQTDRRSTDVDVDPGKEVNLEVELGSKLDNARSTIP